MNLTELQIINKDGSKGRAAGMSFHENPHYASPMESVDVWHARCAAWASGWLRQDEGRDAVISRMVHSTTPI